MMNCNENQLKTLDLSKNMVLEFLHCRENQLTALDVRGCIKLRKLDCDESVTVTGYTLSPPPKNLTLIYLLHGLGLLAIGAGVAALILIRRRRKKRAISDGV